MRETVYWQRPEVASGDRYASCGCPEFQCLRATAVLANPEQIDKLRVVTHGSIPFWALTHGDHRLTFGRRSEPRGAPAGDSRSAPVTSNNSNVVKKTADRSA